MIMMIPHVIVTDRNGRNGRNGLNDNDRNGRNGRNDRNDRNTQHTEIPIPTVSADPPEIQTAISTLLSNPSNPSPVYEPFDTISDRKQELQSVKHELDHIKDDYVTILKVPFILIFLIFTMSMFTTMFYSDNRVILRPHGIFIVIATMASVGLIFKISDMRHKFQKKLVYYTFLKSHEPFYGYTNRYIRNNDNHYYCINTIQLDRMSTYCRNYIKTHGEFPPMPVYSRFFSNKSSMFNKLPTYAEAMAQNNS